MSKVLLPPKRVGDTIIYGANGRSPFDYTSQVGPSESLVSAVMTCTVYSGTDPTPAAVLSGPATVNGVQVAQTVTAGVLGVIYQLDCSALTNFGQTLVLTGLLAVIPDSV